MTAKISIFSIVFLGLLAPAFAVSPDSSNILAMFDSRESSVPQKPSGRHCGKFLAHKIRTVCPDMCTTDVDIATFGCSNQLSDSFIQERCCPRTGELENVPLECVKRMDANIKRVCGSRPCSSPIDVSIFGCTPHLPDFIVQDVCCPQPKKTKPAYLAFSEKPTPECTKHVEDSVEKVCGKRSCPRLDFANFCKYNETDNVIMNFCCPDLLPDDYS